MNNGANIPAPSAPFLDAGGRISSVWWAFLLALFNRTGGAGNPVDLAALESLIEAQAKESAAFTPMPSRAPEFARIASEALVQRMAPTPNTSEGMVFAPPGPYLGTGAASSTYDTISAAVARYAAPPAIGNATPAAGTFTTLKGNSLAKVAAVNTSGQSIASASTYASVTGWTTTYDSNSNFNASTGVFTAPVTGDYWFSFQTAYGSLTGGAGFRAASAIFVGTSNTLAGYVGVPTTTTVVPRADGLIHLTAGQTVTFQASQNSGAATALSVNAPQVSLSIIQLP